VFFKPLLELEYRERCFYMSMEKKLKHRQGFVWPIVRGKEAVKDLKFATSLNKFDESAMKWRWFSRITYPYNLSRL